MKPGDKVWVRLYGQLWPFEVLEMGRVFESGRGGFRTIAEMTPAVGEKIPPGHVLLKPMPRRNEHNGHMEVPTMLDEFLCHQDWVFEPSKDSSPEGR